MSKKPDDDRTARKRIADVLARLPNADAAPPLPRETGPAPPSTEQLSAQRILSVIQAGAWRAWLMRRLAGLCGLPRKPIDPGRAHERAGFVTMPSDPANTTGKRRQ